MKIFFCPALAEIICSLSYIMFLLWLSIALFRDIQASHLGTLLLRYIRIYTFLTHIRERSIQGLNSDFAWGLTSWHICFFLGVEWGHRDLIRALEHSNRSFIRWNRPFFNNGHEYLVPQMTVVSTLYDHLHQSGIYSASRSLFQEEIMIFQRIIYYKIQAA